MKRPKKSRHRHLKNFKTSTAKMLVEVSVSYQMGGANMFTYRNEERGYYLHVQPVEISENFRTFVAFSGIKQLVLQADRYSDRKLKEVAESVWSTGAYKPALEHVAAANSLTLEPEEEADAT